MKGLYQMYMMASLQWWFGNVEVVKHGKTPFSPHQRYLLGYSPHGLFPIGEFRPADHAANHISKESVFKHSESCVTLLLARHCVLTLPPTMGASASISIGSAALLAGLTH